MCDGIDKNQQLLEKLSRQLSELTSSGSAHINEIPPPGIGSQWAQSGGLPSENHPHQHHHSPFSPLYTWDPSFLQAPSSSPSCTSPHLSNPGFNLHEPPTSSSFPFPPPTNYGQVGGHIGNLSPDPGFPAREFQVSGDLSGRFSNIPRSPPPSQDYNPIRSPHHSYHHSQTPIVGRSFGPPASPKEDLFPDLSSVLGGDSSPLSTHRNFDILHSPTVNNQHLHSNSLENVHNSNNSSCDIASSNPFFKPPPTFDPRTPPPSFPLPRQISDSTGQISSASLSSNSTEFLDFLRLQSDPGIGLNLDLGATNLGDTTPWQTFPVENETISSSEEGKQLYSDALNNWNSFDFSDIDNSKTTEDTYNPVQIDEEVSFTEPTVQSQDPSKPSYSDIAKTPKVATSSPRVEQTNSDSTAKSRFVTKDGKPYRPLIQRTISASKFWPKGSSDRVIEQPKVSPTSRYGLDSFEDSPSGLAKTSDSLGCTTRTKRSSSSAAVLDDLSLNMMEKNVNSYKDDSLSTKDLKPRADQKTKSNMVDTQEKVNTSPPSVKMPTVPSSSPEPEEKLFFDPKRIFQPKNTNKSRAQSPAQKVTGKSNVYDKKPSELEDTVLNNGKPTSSSFKLPTAARQHDYINNDLRDTNKVTNKTAAEGVHTTTTVQDINEEVHTKPKESSRSTSGKRSGTGRVNGSFNKDKRKMTDDDTNYKYADAQNGHKFLAANFDREKFDKWLSLAWEKLITWGFFLFTHAKAFFVSALGIFYIVTCSTLQLTWFTASKCWVVIRTKIYAKLGKTTNDSPGWRSKESVRRRVGLEEKIALPSTGEEAMKRLLACKGKDPYSILGVRQDSSDEDIKKYYRKQAVLVHPDKNQEPGAEESFKILGHAFEKIGEPSKRKEYDTQAVVESESELRKEFADLITKLQTKIQEAANLMPCDNCGNKHRRVPVDRPFYSARYCQRCNIRHPAKEGDVWAESSMLGFYWNYYALMEGHVYDITEWMKCHQEFYKRMRANEHTVLTRIATDGNKKAKHHHNREANLEDFINRFFPKMPGQAGGASSQSNGGQAAHGADSAWGQASGSATNAKKAGGGKRKKKRH